MTQLEAIPASDLTGSSTVGVREAIGYNLYDVASVSDAAFFLRKVHGLHRAAKLYSSPPEKISASVLQAGERMAEGDSGTWYLRSLPEKGVARFIGVATVRLNLELRLQSSSIPPVLARRLGGAASQPYRPDNLGVNISVWVDPFGDDADQLLREGYKQVRDAREQHEPYWQLVPSRTIRENTWGLPFTLGEAGFTQQEEGYFDAGEVAWRPLEPSALLTSSS